MHISAGSNQIQKYQTPKVLKYLYKFWEIFVELLQIFGQSNPPKLKDKSRDEPMEIQTPRQVRVPPIL